MRIGSYEIVVRKAAPATSAVVDNRGAWWPWIREPYSGAWQRNDEWTVDTVLAHNAVYTCITLIASDIGKLRFRLVQQDQNGIWSETNSAAFSPVLRRPNHFQNHIQFKENWIQSKLICGNTYVLIERDERNVPVAFYILDHDRVQVLVAPDGSVFYKLSPDNLSGLQTTDNILPASEIMHDRINCIFHPLMGVSPLFASGLAANIGLNIERNSNAFFGGGSNPSGILTAPGPIDQAKADEISARWNAMYSGTRSGKVAVLGNDLKFEGLRMTAVESQLIEQLRWTDETVARTFHVPAFKVGIGSMPTYQNGDTLSQAYYSDCLQSHIEQMEAIMDEGLGLTGRKEGRMLGVELDLEGLLRMDTATQINTLKIAVSGLMTTNEARAKLDLPPVPGGDSVRAQQQDFSLEALEERDRNKPFSKPEAPAAPPVAESADDTKAFEAAVHMHLLGHTAQYRRAYLQRAA